MGAGANAWKEWMNSKFGAPKVGVDTSEDKDTTVIVEDIGTDKTFEELLMPDKPEEEWIWVKGFKGTDKNMQCMDNYQYELGKQFDLVSGDDVELCHNGFHFCKKLNNVFGHYNVENGNRFFEVEALVKKSDFESVNANTHMPYGPYVYMPYSGKRISEDKYAAKSIRFIRELTPDEVFDVFVDSDVRYWTEERKKRAMETSIQTVRVEIRVDELVDAGYSRAFAQYIAGDIDQYKTAMAVASLPDLSTDVKVMSIFMAKDD